MSARRVVGQVIAVGLVGAWMLATGVFIGVMQIVNRIEGRR